MDKKRLLKAINGLLAYGISEDAVDLIELQKGLARLSDINVYRLYTHLIRLNSFRLR